MNHVEFGKSACDTTRRYLDSYISNELLVETNHEVQRHLESCAACMSEMQARACLRRRLKAAVEQQSVPLNLQAQVKELIRAKEPRSWLSAGWPRWALAAAASLVVCSSVWLTYTSNRLPALTDRPAQDAYIRKVSTTLAAVLKVGLGDHIHCSVFRKYPQKPPTVAEMEEKLGPSYQGLLLLVKSAVPEGYQVIMAHQCGYAGRKFVHLTLKNGSHLASLVIARRNEGESLAGMTPTTTSSGVTVIQVSADRYQVAGFESGQYLAFVVSDTEGDTNLQLAADLAPSIHDFLKRTPV
jgi:hypothetical protein